jgi:hypothetical protein
MASQPTRRCDDLRRLATIIVENVSFCSLRVCYFVSCEKVTVDEILQQMSPLQCLIYTSQVLWPPFKVNKLKILVYTGCAWRNVKKLRESVPYVKIYQYNPKHLHPKLNGYGDNDQRSLKLWQLLLTYWLPNTYWNCQEYVVSVMLISVLNIKLICEWHKAIKLNYKNTRNNAVIDRRIPNIIHGIWIAKRWRHQPFTPNSQRALHYQHEVCSLEMA